MRPIYIDLHIHTSEDPCNLNDSYDVDTLLSKIHETAKGESFLISLTDHNTINEKAYIDAIEKISKDYKSGNIILGTELHIRKYRDDSKAYHCHIFFDVEEITKEIIQTLNVILDVIYPKKVISDGDNIPLLEDILDSFDKYDYLLLPHGGQTHSTFDQAIRTSSGNRVFDNVLNKSLYYNFFDGFTSRSNSGIEKTLEYFKKIGIDQFVGLITSSDNYSPDKYPEPKSKEATSYVPTWMLAEPTFDGLRIALSDSTRFIYSENKPRDWERSISNANLCNDEINIDVKFTAGLNVIIGASSSGKTLLVDSINRKLNNIAFDSESDNPSLYNDKFGVSNLEVGCSTGVKPYYIHQNYISGVINTHNHINEIEPLDKLFPDTKEQRKQISKALEDLKIMIDNLFDLVQSIESYEKEIYKIPSLANLITIGEVSENILSTILNKSQENNDALTYSNYFEDNADLDRINIFLKQYPLINHNEETYKQLLSELDTAREYSNIHTQINKILCKYKNEVDLQLEEKLGNDQKRKKDFEKLIDRMRKYGLALNEFGSTVDKIVAFKKTYETPEEEINGHKLYFEGNIQINEGIIVEAMNKYLLNNKKVKNLSNLLPSDLYTKNFSKTQPSNPIGANLEYSIISKNIFNVISQKDQSHPKIKTKNNEDFDNISPGKKTAVILDLILSFEGDSAPIIIDQPEDNLSSEYMNTELIDLIKKVKEKKQIIFVSHNATIPMIGDAQNVILCRNENKKIIIKSAQLEGKINGKKVVDYVISITDGGKQSVKKRFKKYNLKNFN